MALLWISFLWGAAFGAAARWGRFCLLRGMRQFMGRNRSEQTGALQAFALALSVALLTSQGLQLMGVLDLGEAQIVRSSFSPLGVFLGGAIFALGMVLANACGARSLVLLAGGNLRSLITVVFLALGAQASATGVLAPLRQWFQGLPSVSLEHVSAAQSLLASGFSPLAVYALLAVIPALILAVYALRDPALRRSPAQWISAVFIGALVALGWWITASFQIDPFEPAKLTSLSFIAPVAESLLYLQVAVGRPWSPASAMILGVLVGAAIVAILSGTARWESFENAPNPPRQLAKSAVGGLLMGFGGFLAVGCSIGQVLTGVTTLAWATLPAVAGITLGTVCSISALRIPHFEKESA